MEFNGTTDRANYGWTAGVHDLNVFYDVRPPCPTLTEAGTDKG